MIDTRKLEKKLRSPRTSHDLIREFGGESAVRQMKLMSNQGKIVIAGLGSLGGLDRRWVYMMQPKRWGAALRRKLARYGLAPEDMEVL